MTPNGFTGMGLDAGPQAIEPCSSPNSMPIAQGQPFLSSLPTMLLLQE